MPKTKDPKAHGHLRSGKWITDKRRFAIYLRDNCNCVYCGESIRLAIGTAGAVLDHVIPDGGNHETNLVTCCKPCNDAKGGSPVESFCNGDALKRVRRAIATNIDEARGREFYNEFKGARSESILPPLPFLRASEAAALIGITGAEFLTRVEDGRLSKPTEAGFDIKTVVRETLRNRAEKEGGEITNAEASRQLTVARKQQIDLEMEVTRGDRWPKEDVENIHETSLSNVAGLLKAHEGKTLTPELIRDIFTELREVPAKLAKL